MAAITLQRLKHALAEAYEQGYSGCLDLKDNAIEEIVNRLLNTPNTQLSQNDGWRLFTAKELRGMPIGTIFDHNSRGKGWIAANGPSRFMMFAVGDLSHFYSDESPWDEPMRVIGHVAKPMPPKKKKEGEWIFDV